jgi:Glycosyltransferases involved in cell wall biogenesis
MSDFLISIIIPVYNEGSGIDTNAHIVHKILDEHNINHELIFINDGSSDNTWDEIVRVSKEIDSMRGICFSRNFGKEAALCAGLSSALGDSCVIIDGDLQHPPELIPKMVDIWKNNDIDIVEGIKSSRGKESIFSKAFAKLFYGTLEKVSGIDLDMASDFKLLDRKAVDAWKTMGEHNTFFRGMSTWVGFKKEVVYFEVQPRLQGETKWSFKSLLGLAVNAITSFSSAPLYIVTILGMLFLIGSFILGIQTLYNFIIGAAVSGFTTTILLLLLTGSGIMISLGIIGTYIAKIYDEVKQRPRYIISETTSEVKK